MYIVTIIYSINILRLIWYSPNYDTDISIIIVLNEQKHETAAKNIIYVY